MATQDIIVSPATVWVAPVGEPNPDRNTVGYGDPWGGNWRNMGYTTSPLSLSYSSEEFALSVEQSTLDICRVRVGEDMSFSTTLAEMTAENMALVLNGVSAITAAAAGVVGAEEVKSGGQTDIPTYKFGFEVLNKDATGTKLPARGVLHVVTAGLDGSMEFAKNAAAGLPVMFKSLGDSSLPAGEQAFQWIRVTDEAL